MSHIGRLHEESTVLSTLPCNAGFVLARWGAKKKTAARPQETETGDEEVPISNRQRRLTNKRLDCAVWAY